MIWGVIWGVIWLGLVGVLSLLTIEDGCGALPPQHHIPLLTSHPSTPNPKTLNPQPPTPNPNPTPNPSIN